MFLKVRLFVGSHLNCSSNRRHVISKVLFAILGSFDDGFFRQKGPDIVINKLLRPTRQCLVEGFLGQDLQPRFFVCFFSTVVVVAATVKIQYVSFF